MTLEIAQATFYNIPVALVQSIIHTIGLVTDDKPNIRYRDGMSDTFQLTQATIDEDWNTVDMFISYYIDDSMTYTFQIFLSKFVEDKLKDYNLLEKCWSIDTND